MKIRFAIPLVAVVGAAIIGGATGALLIRGAPFSPAAPAPVRVSQAANLQDETPSTVTTAPLGPPITAVTSAAVAVTTMDAVTAPASVDSASQAAPASASVVATSAAVEASAEPTAAASTSTSAAHATATPAPSGTATSPNSGPTG